MKIRKKVTLIISIIVIVALGVIAIAIYPYFVTFDGCKLCVARSAGSAISATIDAEHSDYLINAVPYTLDDCLVGTSFNGGMTYNTTPNNTPARGEICSNVGGTKITCNVKGDIFEWTYTPRVGDTPALITEDSATAFSLN